MKRIIGYAFVFLLGLAIFLVVFAPAATVWQFAKPDVTRQVPDLQVISLNGTIWRGEGSVRYWNLPPISIAWSVLPGSLIHGRVDVIGQLVGDHFHLQGNTRLEQETSLTNIEGFVGNSWVNAVSNNYGLKFSGDLKVDRLSATSDYRWFRSASGMLHWAGGQIVYRTARGAESFVLPALDGRLYMSGDDLHLDVTQKSAPVMEITLHRTGWVKVDLKGRLFDLAKLPWPGGQPQGDTALSVETQLFPAR